MAYYNNQFPMTYQPVYYPQYQPPQPQPQQTQPVPAPQPTNNGIIWVSGEAGAKAYLVAPNTTVQLWDSETQRIFLKSADATGMPTMKVLTYTIEDAPSVNVSKAVSGATEAAQTQDGEIYWREAREALEGQIGALRGDLEAIRSEVETFRGDLYGIAGKKVSTSKRREASADE